MGKDRSRAVRTKPKRKSIKAKTTNFGSKRKLSRMGKMQKKGLSGPSAHFVTRSKALKILQVSLKDFRRLCILKGIYPRDPKKKLKGANKTYYHLKDILFLSHEPLLNKFREFKTFLKRIKKYLGKNEIDDAKRAYDHKPTYTLDHLVKERYPRFQDAVADIDDALTLVHLFAYLPSSKGVTSKKTQVCSRLAREWQLWVTKSHSLTKVFISVKGIYYQAEVNGQKVIWIVPHKFTQSVPSDIDLSIMLTFLEFYETLLGFVLFKLYNDIGFRYPPAILQSKEVQGEFLRSLVTESISKSKPSNDVDENQPKSKKQKTSKSESKPFQSKNVKVVDPDVTPEMLQRMGTIDAVLKKIEKISKEEEDGNNMEEDEEKDKDENDEDAEDPDDPALLDETAKLVKDKQKEMSKFKKLFKGLKFYVSREVPRDTLEFAILSMNGDVAYEVDGNPKDLQGVTHVITDRETGGLIKERIANCEYIQPQWVFDSINARMLLPVSRYDPASEDLPPHLSPFVDNHKLGYIPAYAKELEELKAARMVPSLRKKEAAASDENEKNDDKDEKNPEDEEEYISEDEADRKAGKEYSEELQNELKRSRKDMEESTDESEDIESEEDDDEEEEDDGEEDSENDEDEEDEDEEDEEESDDDDEMEEEKPKKKEAAKPTKNAEPEVAKKAPKELQFIPCSSFTGAKKGYYFKKGALGLGYYKFINREITFAGGSGMSKRAKRRQEEAEELQRSKMVMKGKAKRLYNKMQHGIKEKQHEIQKLKRRRERLEKGN